MTRPLSVLHTQNRQILLLLASGNVSLITNTRGGSHIFKDCSIKAIILLLEVVKKSIPSDGRKGRNY